MAGSKRIPLTLGVGGRVIGSGLIDENGLFMAEIDDPEVYREVFRDDYQLSLHLREESDNG